MDPARKRCCSCGKEQSLDQFNKRKAASDGLQSRCRTCCRLWYVANAAAHKANVRRRNDEQRHVLHEQLAAYLRQHPCVDCGETDIRCLEFDHRDRSTKSAEISRLVAGAFAWEVLLREIEKCDVRCANCHRRRTADQFSTWRHRLHEVETADLRDVAQGRLRKVLPATRGRPDGGRVVDGPDP
ncbi:MAG TPA: hypothetical protein VFR56_11760 [Actinomycetes bacterium]|nr:hypothetical protein [Actinomycetes bacterium]